MTAPQEPGTPTLPVAVRGESVSLSNAQGETVEVSPGDAVEMLRRGWQPTELGMARALRADQIPREVAAEGPDLGKFGYGVARGVATPLIDLALPEGNRVHELLAEDSPWLVHGGEATGMVGSTLLGLGPAAALDAGAQAVARTAGAGAGALRTAFARSAQGALEGGAYGAMNSVAEAHSQNVPLTAQRFASEVVPGLLFGGVLGGGFGAIEGALGKLGGRTITEALGAADESKLDDIFKAGVSDADALRIAQREFGVKDPTAWQRMQALANGEVSAERRALMADSGPVGQRARADAFLGEDKLLAAERQLVQDGDAYLQARDAAMSQLNAGTKGRHIAEELVGEATADAADVSRAVREAAMDSGDWASDSARRAAFVEKAVDSLPAAEREKLIRTLGVSSSKDGVVERLNAVGLRDFKYARDGMRDESLKLAKQRVGRDRPVEVALYPDEAPVLADGRHRLRAAIEAKMDELPAIIRTYDADGNVISEVTRKLSIESKTRAAGSLQERLISGLANGHQETISALEQALGAANLSDDAMKGLTGQQGNWASTPLGFFNKWREQAQVLEALPKGVNADPGDIRRILGNLQNYEGPVLMGKRAQAASALDNLKKQLAAYAKPGERLGIGDRSAMMARDMYEELRVMLEDPKLWGERFAGFQKRVNALVHEDMGVAGEFDGLFVKKIGRPDPADPWRSARAMDDSKVSKGLEQMSDPKQLKQLERLREHFDDQAKFMNETLSLKGLDGAARQQIEAGLESLKRMRASLDNAVYLNASQRQAQALMGFSPLSPNFAGRMAVGAVLGGKAGAVAGALASMSPGRLLQLRAIMERMATQTESRLAKGIAGLLGARPGELLKQAGGAVGKAAGKTSRANGKVAAVVAHALEERGDQRQQTYQRTVQQLVEARQRLPELQKQIDEIMPDLELTMPGTKTQMMEQTARGIDFVLTHLPLQPQLRLYGTRGAPLSDQDYSDFVRMTAAALEPASILDMAADGELTAKAVAAAEASAPEFVNYIRSETARAVTDHPGAVSYEKRIQASLVLGTPLDATLEPDFIALQQATHQSRAKFAEAQKESRGTGGETGVNKRYMSESDKMELDEPPR